MILSLLLSIAAQAAPSNTCTISSSPPGFKLDDGGSKKHCRLVVTLPAPPPSRVRCELSETNGSHYPFEWEAGGSPALAQAASVPPGIWTFSCAAEPALVPPVPRQTSAAADERWKFEAFEVVNSQAKLAVNGMTSPITIRSVARLRLEDALMTLGQTGGGRSGGRSLEVALSPVVAEVFQILAEIVAERGRAAALRIIQRSLSDLACTQLTENLVFSGLNKFDCSKDKHQCEITEKVKASFEEQWKQYSDYVRVRERGIFRDADYRDELRLLPRTCAAIDSVQLHDLVQDARVLYRALARDAVTFAVTFGKSHLKQTVDSLAYNVFEAIADLAHGLILASIDGRSLDARREAQVLVTSLATKFAEQLPVAQKRLDSSGDLDARVKAAEVKALETALQVARMNVATSTKVLEALGAKEELEELKRFLSDQQRAVDPTLVLKPLCQGAVILASAAQCHAYRGCDARSVADFVSNWSNYFDSEVCKVALEGDVDLRRVAIISSRVLELMNLPPNSTSEEAMRLALRVGFDIGRLFPEQTAVPAVRIGKAHMSARRALEIAEKATIAAVEGDIPNFMISLIEVMSTYGKDNDGPRRLSSLLSSLLAFARTYVDPVAGEAELTAAQKKEARRSAVVSVIDAFSERSDLSGRNVFTFGVAAGFRASGWTHRTGQPNFGNGNDAVLLPTISLPLGLGYQHLPATIRGSSRPGLGFHFLTYVIDVGQFLPAATTERDPAAPEWYAFLSPGAQVGILLGWPEDVFVAAIDFHVANVPRNDPQNESDLWLRLGVVFAYYVPLFDFVSF